MVKTMKSKARKFKPMSQKEISHFSTQNERLLILSNKNGDVSPCDIWEEKKSGAKRAKDMLKHRKV